MAGRRTSKISREFISKRHARFTFSGKRTVVLNKTASSIIKHIGRDFQKDDDVDMMETLSRAAS